MNKLVYSLIILFSFHLQAIGAAAVFSGGAAVVGTVRKTVLEAKELVAGTIKVAGPVIKPLVPSLLATTKTALISSGAALTSVASQVAPVAQTIGSGALSIVQGVNTAQQAAATTFVSGVVVGKVIEKLSGKPAEKVLPAKV